MQILAVASQKGGSGKTTLAGHMAVQAGLAGDGPVALVDTDPQGSLSDWWSERGTDEPRFVHTTAARLAHDIRKLRAAGIRILFIDTPPAITSTIGHVIDAADLVVIPTRPSPHDLRAIGATVELAERMAKPLVFVINGSAPRARLTAEAAVALGQFGPLAPTIVHQRTDFAASMIDGRTVMELRRRSRSPDEMAELWRYLRRQLPKVPRRPPRRRKTAAPAQPAASMALEGAAAVNGDARHAKRGRSPKAAAKPAGRKSASRPVKSNGAAEAASRKTVGVTAKPNGAAKRATRKTRAANGGPASRKTVDATAKPNTTAKTTTRKTKAVNGGPASRKTVDTTAKLNTAAKTASRKTKAANGGPASRKTVGAAAKPNTAAKSATRKTRAANGGPASRKTVGATVKPPADGQPTKRRAKPAVRKAASGEEIRQPTAS